MAQLGSPGVQVNVIDESFYNPAQPGTVPLVLIATAQDKVNASGTGIAAGTQATYANSLYLATSQKDLTDRFGTPTFQKDASGNAIQGSELSEYGLFSTYSFLGASNSAYVLRANVDLDALQSKANVPVGSPEGGTYWLDSSKTRFGIFEWNADPLVQDFTSKTVTVLNSESDVVDFENQDLTPKASIGTVGSYAVVTVGPDNVVWFKNTDNVWVAVGSNNVNGDPYDHDAFVPHDWVSSWPVVTTGNIATITGTAKSFTVVYDGNDYPVELLITTDTIDEIHTIIKTALSSTPILTRKTTDGQRIQFFSTEGLPVEIVGAVAPAISALTALGLTAGVYEAPGLAFSSHTKVPFWRTTDDTPRPSGSVWVKTTEFNSGAKWYVSLYNADSGLFETKTTSIFEGTKAALVGLDPVGGGSNIALGTLFANANFDSTGIANFKLTARAFTGETVATSATATAASEFAGSGTVIVGVSTTDSTNSNFAEVTLNFLITQKVETFVSRLNGSAIGQYVTAGYSSTGKLTLTHNTGGEIFLGGTELASLGFVVGGAVFDAPAGDAIYTGGLRVSNWADLTSYATSGLYEVGSTQPTSTPADGTLWYAGFQDEVDIMIHNGTVWAGYAQVLSGLVSDTVIGPYVQATKPTTRRNGGTLLQGEIWVDTSVQDSYGKTIKRWNASSKTWDLVDTTDHTSQYGIIFADARWNTTGLTAVKATITDLAKSAFVDFDAPDPAAYPRGTMLFNTRRSGFNIKQYKKSYVPTNDTNTRLELDELMTNYYPDRWVSVSGQDLNQVAHFGRQAQRSYVVGQLKAAINTNQRILDEDNIFFNLIACPGYPELISDMVNLNNSRNGTALVVGDTPMRLDSTANSITNYGTDYYNSGIDGELGLHTNSDHLAVYYPSGLTTDLTGSNVVVPPSYMMLRTIAISDQRSFQWFAPAGTRRGGVTNASSVGYLKDGSFIPVSLNQGTRDQMAQVKINPITNIPGAGLVAFGQYTKSGVNSSLDRINVARLVSYLRRQLGIITKPFLFEPNDKQTRSEIKNVCESLMLDMVSLRGIYDFIVVCDETNNSSTVISNNQLYVDIAIEPVKAVEFIYIPLRLKNVGDIKSRQ